MSQPAPDQQVGLAKKYVDAASGAAKKLNDLVDSANKMKNSRAANQPPNPVSLGTS